jgi:hypothetical protein
VAGNWIKVEHVTPDKPEIAAIAEALGIDVDAVFGKCMRLWIWADQHTISGDDLPVTLSSLNRITNCANFAEALQKVGWIKVKSPNPNTGFQKALPALLQIFGIENPSMRDERDLYETFLDLKAKKATDAELRRRVSRYRELYPELPMTQRAILNNWHSLKPKQQQSQPEVEGAVPDAFRKDHG